MPYKPAKPCAYPGCPRLTRGTYCEEHTKEMNRRYERYDRTPEARKRYGRSWRKIRMIYAGAHPFCEQCFDKGIIVPVEEVHHKVPLAEGGTHDEENLMALCKSCHSRIHTQGTNSWGRAHEY